MNKKVEIFFLISLIIKMEMSDDWKTFFYSKEEKITIFNLVSKEKKIRFLMMSILNCNNEKNIKIMMKKIVKLLS